MPELMKSNRESLYCFKPLYNNEVYIGHSRIVQKNFPKAAF